MEPIDVLASNGEPLSEIKPSPGGKLEDVVIAVPTTVNDGSGTKAGRVSVLGPPEVRDAVIAIAARVSQQ